MRTSRLSLASWAAIGGGALMILAGWLTATELGSMLTGYGLLFVLSGAYLGAGLAIRDRLRGAAAARRRPVERQSLLGRRVF